MSKSTFCTERIIHLVSDADIDRSDVHSLAMDDRVNCPAVLGLRQANPSSQSLLVMEIMLCVHQTRDWSVISGEKSLLSVSFFYTKRCFYISSSKRCKCCRKHQKLVQVTKGRRK